MKVMIHMIAHPTEDIGKLRTAILNLFPGARLEVEGLHITGETDSLDHFRTLLKNQQIRTTAYDLLSKGKICPGPTLMANAYQERPDDEDENEDERFDAAMPGPEPSSVSTMEPMSSSEPVKAVTTALYLNKQAAYMGFINFSIGGSPLGNIQVLINDDDLDARIEWLTSTA